MLCFLLFSPIMTRALASSVAKQTDSSSRGVPCDAPITISAHTSTGAKSNSYCYSVPPSAHYHIPYPHQGKRCVSLVDSVVDGLALHICFLHVLKLLSHLVIALNILLKSHPVLQAATRSDQPITWQRPVGSFKKFNGRSERPNLKQGRG